MAEQTWENYEQSLFRTAFERGREEAREENAPILRWALEQRFGKFRFEILAQIEKATPASLQASSQVMWTVEKPEDLPLESNERIPA